MRVRGKKDRASLATLDITPTIDVVFLLLIFFIATIRLPEPEANIRAYLPRTVDSSASGEMKADEAEAETENVNRIQIKLRTTPGGSELSLNGAVLKGGFRQLDQALASLGKISAQSPEVKSKVILDVDSRIPYRYVVRAIDTCAKHKFDDVSFAISRKGTVAAPQGEVE